jgi:hypothetical protein
MHAVLELRAAVLRVLGALPHASAKPRCTRAPFTRAAASATMAYAELLWPSGKGDVTFATNFGLLFLE